jgi:predicted ester cyclase
LGRPALLTERRRGRTSAVSQTIFDRHKVLSGARAKHGALLLCQAEAVTEASGEDLRELYCRYNATCNAHEFDQLGEFVDADVMVNGRRQGLSSYQAGLADVVRAFPDYRWQLEHLVVDEPWVAAHFIDTGTHQAQFLGLAATGRAVRTQEFAVYRFAQGRIVEVWVTADNLGLLDQLQREVMS